MGLGVWFVLVAALAVENVLLLGAASANLRTSSLTAALPHKLAKATASERASERLREADAGVRRPSKSAGFRPPTAPPHSRPTPGGVGAANAPQRRNTVALSASGEPREEEPAAGSFGCVLERSLLPIDQSRTRIGTA